MEVFWFILLVSLFLCVALKSLLNILQYTTAAKARKLPSGAPPASPILSNLKWLLKSLLPNIYQTHPTIFITTQNLAHKALIKNSAVFAGRPPSVQTHLVTSSNNHTISSATYGSLWRILRRNLTSEILQPSRLRSNAHGRKWALEILNKKLKAQAKSGEPVCVMDQFHHSMFCLLTLMCFGEKLDDKIIEEIEATQHALLNTSRFNILNSFPRLGKILFRNRWYEFLEIRRNQENVILPLIKARQAKKEQQVQHNEEFIVSYVDTLLDLRLPDEGGRKLNDEEMVSLCSEFVNAGTHTTPTVFEWTMANLVKHQDIQAKLFDEIEQVVGSEDEIKEEDLKKMPYLKAVVFEAIRRHPPFHFLLPHAVTEKDFYLDGYYIPKNATVNFMAADIAWDPNVWEDPMEFRPERLLNSEGEVVCDITGNREIKMIPFGAGRRICPGYGLAILILQYFVANLVREYKWTAKDGEEVDLTEKHEITTMMKYPLRALITPRMK